MQGIERSRTASQEPPPPPDPLADTRAACGAILTRMFDALVLADRYAKMGASPELVGEGRESARDAAKGFMSAAMLQHAAILEMALNGSTPQYVEMEGKIAQHSAAGIDALLDTKNALAKGSDER